MTLKENLYGIIWTGACGFAFWAAVAYFSPDNWSIKYFALYGAPSGNVTIENMPKSCDFYHAPIGEKSCHYEKITWVTRWEKSITGDPIVSYDDGKTWQSFTPDSYFKYRIPSTHVNVMWERKED